ncbi:hypothetical protein [Nannocystis bainbridge]|uniref:Uncharacterized protein n=1 Tax=Nannocystis bainbridge TaxID=2995303 RepID=A0ABT5DW31_9BACT|nr:hypothetical protein [Nannocystis bainbridge]MDC0717799.1 hypothetical protein [Nannocystis bainbridge]
MPKTRRGLSLVCALFVAAVPAAPALAAPADPPAASPTPAPSPAKSPTGPSFNGETIARASLAIDTNGAGPAGPVIHERLDEVGNRQLRRAEVLPGRGPRDPWIRLTVRAVPGEEPGYVILSGLYVGNDPVGDSVHETECRLCTEGEAVERGTSEIERLVPFVRDFAEAEREARAKAATPPPEPPKPVEPPPPKGLGGRGKAGVALLAVGGVGFFVGLGLAVRQPRPDPDMPLYEISTRPAGIATLGIGLAAVVTGAVLLALDRKAAKRRVSWQPSVGRGSAGLLLSGSF